MVVSGATRMPHSAPRPAASVKARRPACVVPMPTSRAPSRFTDVARNALPEIERSKYRYSAPINTTAVPTTHKLCPEIDRLPTLNVASENAVVREPSAPNMTRPRPTIAKCTATATISSSSVDASAIGSYASR